MLPRDGSNPARRRGDLLWLARLQTRLCRTGGRAGRIWRCGFLAAGKIARCSYWLLGEVSYQYNGGARRVTRGTSGAKARINVGDWRHEFQRLRKNSLGFWRELS